MKRKKIKIKPAESPKTSTVNADGNAPKKTNRRAAMRRFGESGLG